MSCASILRWHKSFIEGREDEHQTGWLSNILYRSFGEHTCPRIRRSLFKCLADVEYHTQKCSDYSDDLLNWWVACRWITHFVIAWPNGVLDCSLPKTRVRKHWKRFINNIVTIDGSWMLHYDPEIKQQGSPWKTSNYQLQRNLFFKLLRELKM